MLVYRTDTLGEQEGIICGMMLGDGGRQGGTSHHSMCISHSMGQESYALFKRDLLSNITGSPVRVKYVVHHLKEYNKNYSGVRVYPCKHHIITGIVDELYQYGEKKITDNILNKLTLQGISIWYMDDGSNSLNYVGDRLAGVTVTLNTYVSIQENQYIIEYFKNTYNITWHINKSKNSWRLSMSTKEARKLFNIISPYIIPSMRYKLLLVKNGLLSDD